MVFIAAMVYNMATVARRDADVPFTPKPERC